MNDLDVSRWGNIGVWAGFWGCLTGIQVFIGNRDNSFIPVNDCAHSRYPLQNANVSCGLNDEYLQVTVPWQT